MHHTLPASERFSRALKAAENKAWELMAKDDPIAGEVMEQTSQLKSYISKLEALILPAQMMVADPFSSEASESLEKALENLNS